MISRKTVISKHDNLVEVLDSQTFAGKEVEPLRL